MNKTILTLLAQLILSACATVEVDQLGRNHFSTIDSFIKLYPRHENCCTDITSIPYQSIEYDKEYTFEINDNTPVFEFNFGRSHFIALELPKTDRLYRISVESHLAKGLLFFPMLLVLDGRHQKIKQISQETFLYKKTNDFSYTLLEGEIVVNENEDQARYLIIHTPDISWQGYLLALRFPHNPIGVRDDQSYYIHYAAQGKITMRFDSVHSDRITERKLRAIAQGTLSAR